jgi:opacity protein-like surface antigen
MKTKTFACLAGISLATAAQAGTPAIETAPATSAGLWQWFVGASAGYLTDLDEGMYGLQAGMEYRPSGERASHAIYLEIGFTQDDASYSNVPAPGTTGGITADASIDLDIIPITLNYRYQSAITDRLNWHAGLGLGVAILDSSYDWSWSQVVAPPYPSSGKGDGDDSDVVFFGDVFAGLSYDVSESFCIIAGVRYIFMDNKDWEIEQKGVSYAYEGGIDGDVLVEIGARYRF